MATAKGIKGALLSHNPDNNNTTNRANASGPDLANSFDINLHFNHVNNLDQGIVEACAHGSHALCAELAGARNYGGLVHAAVASEGNPLSSSIGSNSPTLFDMAAQSSVWSSVRGSNQRGGDMLTGATVVHRKEALYGLGSRCMSSWNPS